MNAPPAIMEFLTLSLGMEPESAGKDAVNRAVAAVMRHEGVSDPRAFEKLFGSSPDVRQRLIDAVVVGETWFFRDRGPFLCLARHALDWHKARPGNVLNVLSAPCATGEEPYSIVMTLLAAGLPPSSFTVDGVDVSALALEKARRACYSKSAFRGNIGQDVARFFETTPSGRKVADPVVRRVAFHLDNLALPGSLAGRGPYAIIFCRNLLIYMTPEARLRIFDRMDRLLIPGGLLFTGHTETNFWHQRGYMPLPWDRAFALTKPASSASFAAAVPAGSTAKPISPKGRPGKIAVLPTGSAAKGKTPIHPDTGPPETPSGERRQPAKPEAANADVKIPPMDAQIQEARRLADAGDTAGAARLCREYTRKFGPAAETYCLMGILSMAGQDLSGAEECFLKALYLDPNHYESLVHISLIYRQKGKETRAALYRERAERKATVKE